MVCPVFSGTNCQLYHCLYSPGCNSTLYRIALSFTHIDGPGADPGFFQEGCTRLLLYFNTNKSQLYQKPKVISGRGGAHPLYPPPRSAPAVICATPILKSDRSHIRYRFLCHSLCQCEQAGVAFHVDLISQYPVQPCRQPKTDGFNPNKHVIT